MDGEEQGEGQEETNMYTHYNGTHNNVCTKLRTTVYGGGRGLRGPVGVGWCACDKTINENGIGNARGIHTFLVAMRVTPRVR